MAKLVQQQLVIDEAQILDRDADWFTRGVWEAIYIRSHKPTLNRHGGGGGGGGEIQPSSDLDKAWSGHMSRDLTKSL